MGQTSILPGVKGRLGTHLEYIKSGVHIKTSDWIYLAYSWIYESGFLGKTMD